MTGFTGHLQITVALAALLLPFGVPVRPSVLTPHAPCVSESAGPYLHTCGPTIVDAHGHAVRLRAVNWYGFESNDFVVAGLDHRPLRAIIGTIKSLGYNGLRLPFSNEMVESNPVVSHRRRSCPQGAPATACRPIDGWALLAANPDLRGLTALRILKTIVDDAGAHGLYVFLDDHRSRAGWGPQENGLWYDNAHGYTQSSWVRDWQHVVRLFAHDPALTGVDLFNEPHSLGLPRTCAPYLTGHGASWGTCAGKRNPLTDWRAAAAVAGNAVLAINPHLLVVVEGTSVAPDAAGHFTTAADGGNLAAAGEQPVRLTIAHRLVYSIHEYYDFDRNAGIDPARMGLRWSRLFGYLTNPATPIAVPVWVGEFGTCTTSRYCAAPVPGEADYYCSCETLVPDPKHPRHFIVIHKCRHTTCVKVLRHSHGYWFDAFVRYLNTPPYRGAPAYGWAYWPLNGTTPDNYSFLYKRWVTRVNDRETFGLLNTAWIGLSMPAVDHKLFSDIRVTGELVPARGRT